MKNVTVSLDDESYRRARVKAAEMGKSLSAVVREYLTTIGSEQEDREARRQERLRVLWRRMDAEGSGLSAAENVSRDALYDEILRDRHPTYFGGNATSEVQKRKRAKPS